MFLYLIVNSSTSCLSNLPSDILYADDLDILESDSEGREACRPLKCCAMLSLPTNYNSVAALYLQYKSAVGSDRQNLYLSPWPICYHCSLCLSDQIIISFLGNSWLKVELLGADMPPPD